MAEDLITNIGTAFSGNIENLRRLPRNAEELATETQRLIDLREDMRRLAENQARQTRGTISNQLSGWMTRVETLAAAADEFKTSFENLGSSRLVTRYSLSTNVVDLLQEVAKLIDQGNSLSDRGLLLQPQQPDAVQHVPSEITSATLAGGEEPLQQIKSYIMDGDTGIVGIYGMGGVGKTTLLKVINNEFLTEQDCRVKFDLAIWVTVSREAKDTSSIQQMIASRLQIPLSDDMMHNSSLFTELMKRRFILLLDDVWERLDLAEIGIPLPKNMENRGKILFTTRSEEVCREMDADELVKVVPLDAERSWELFCSKFGRNSRRVLDDPNIQPLAKQVAAKCGGLPISLITVARAMARAKTEDDWWDAIAKLDHHPAELSRGMENDVLQSLWFSFEKLKNKTLKNCLLYFALFPEDWYILKEEIIDYWVCEGFLDSKEFDEPDIADTRRRGNNLITDLQNACLLESYEEGSYDGVFLPESFIKLHDTVRDMVLWIGGHEFVFMARSNRIPKLEVWQKATRISLTDNRQIKEPPSSGSNLSCPNLTTLLLRGSSLGSNIPRHPDFLTCSSMPALKVLDLSWTDISALPIGITSLTSLQFLSLQHNKLTSLPVELGNLVNLRNLILRYNELLRPIPREALLRLCSLQVLDMRYIYRRTEILPQLDLDNLRNLRSLRELHLFHYDFSWESLKVIVESPVLCRSIRELIIRGGSPPPLMGEAISWQVNRLSEWINRLELCGDQDKPVKGELELHSDRLQHLHDLYISNFIEAKISLIRGRAAPIFPRLTYLGIGGCGCYDLTWIGGLPCLQNLMLENCGELTEILPNGSSSNDQTIPPFFPKLQVMTLWDLPSLRSISMRTLLLPSLEALAVRGCPQLRRLPFGYESAPYIQHIAGPKVWWDRLEWDMNDGIRERFSSKFCGK